MSEPSAATSGNHPHQSDRSIVTVVRHACAGDKQDWPGDDAKRPLDEGGTRQATALADTLASASVQYLVASPTKRCIDTLRPLAARLQLDIETTDSVGPGGSIEELIADERALPSGTVVCTHGELMRPILEHVQADLIPIRAEHDDDEWLLSKGSAWRLVVDPHGDVTELTHVAPLPLPDCGGHADSD
jgi:phosphohistidine phosphatase SixA